MDDPPDDETPYEIGYGKPPRARRFKKGRSGNPRGRPRGSKSLATLVREQRRKQVLVKVGGREKTMPVDEALITRVFRAAAAGDRRAMDQGLKLLERYSTEDEKPEPEWKFGALSDEEMDEFERLLAKITPGAGACD